MFLIKADERIEQVRQRKYRVEILDRQKQFFASLYPAFAVQFLALGTMSVTAGIIVNFCVTTVITAADVTAKCTGFT